MRATKQHGFTLIETVVGISVSLLIFAAAFSTESSTIRAFRTNEPIASMDTEISRIGARLDRELRRASAATLEVPGSPFPTTPTTGTAYTSLTFRIIRYDEITLQTVTDATVRSIQLNGTDLELTDDAGTMVIGKNITNLSLVWDGAARTVSITIQAQRTMPDNSTQTRTKTIQVQLRNT